MFRFDEDVSFTDTEGLVNDFQMKDAIGKF